MQYVKTAEGQWLFTEMEGESAILSLQTIDFKMNLNELYAQVNFSDSDAEN